MRSNVARVRERMAAACERAGREPDSVRLLLATKTVEPARIRVAIEAGETLVAENRVQEVRPKFEALEDLRYERHFIGHLQSNKINALVPYISCLETLDRLSLARKLQNRLAGEGETLEVLVQVNTSGEPTKAGLDPDEVEPFIRTIAGLDALKVRGLMTIGLNAEPEVARPSLASLREIAGRIREENIEGVAMEELSMGMTGDLEVAIEEGSTIVRVGSAIFGSRPPLQSP
ncbi:MAG TPA: YggS family pyridoxal phosphate-dependent enzyme [Solirubrobacterales bacterium]|nr:YggS family pyridoxal phosphate-dependent enzyme [Solirubrobacterales bacterium]HMY25144.1 YggS family pyridoxal phosphate-dependent enzyme [Solirubrobacterales bacterium]HNA23192.1 YggS family pyridoxal phosphate-dependent enzyme [Solirubrobacterales bacterium]HNA43057.1 YggS family pyridoxal phosphate-dependent enzyme [Solirubrobacterales bacterium]HNC93279.1 YggS family pyridoxal phosphate-dependent enzyme [Solirubrobacterales bacterium]